MNVMILSVFVLLLCSSAWVAGLWFVAQPDFLSWSTPGLLAWHAAPPLSVWFGWMVLRRYRQRNKTEQALQREAKAQAEGEAAKADARRKHEEELRQRRYACDCRAVVLAQIATVSGLSSLPFMDQDERSVVVDFQTPEQLQQVPGGPMLDHLASAISDALTALYSSCAASMVFPIYVLPPSEVSGEEVISLVREIHAGLRDELADDIRISGGGPSILFLPAADSAANSLISLFESAPDLPGAVVLAFDSPLMRMAPKEPFSDEALSDRTEQQLGKAGRGAVALLVTQAGLPGMLEMVEGAGDGSAADSMTPFWERSLEPGGGLALLARLGAQRREELAALPTLGKVHRAVISRAPSLTGTLEMTRLARAALERAQINAGLIDVPFSSDAGSAQASGKAAEAQVQADAPPLPRIAGMVHNAGGVDTAGRRLGALGGALYYFDIDLNPVDPMVAANTAAYIGNLGRASSLAQLALGVILASAKFAPVLCAEFEGDDIAASVVMPASAKG